MKEFVEKKGTELEHSERDLLSVAYKNVVGSRRNAWRVVSAVSENMTSNKTIATDYLKTIEDELESICNEVLVSWSLCQTPQTVIGLVCRNFWINICWLLLTLTPNPRYFT